jgi:hypothetical protein
MLRFLCLVAAATAATIHSKRRVYNTASKIIPGKINVHLVPHSHG